MAFTIYPDATTATLLGKPVNTPILLAPNEAMSVFVPLAGDVGPDPDELNLSTTFIRIAASGAALALPHVDLIAHNPGTNTDGASVQVTAQDVGSAQGLSDGNNPTDAAAAYFSPPYADNVFLLKVIIDIPGTTLKLRITNDATARSYVWVVADNGADSQQPWIHASPATLAYSALINQSATETAQSIQVANFGTGDLLVNDVTPAPASPYALVTTLPATVSPNSTSNVAIGVAPTAIGATPSSNFLLESTDAGAVPTSGGHNDQFALSANVGQLEVVLVLDDSGSMNTRPDGSSLPNPPPVDPTARWSELRTAAKAFLETLATFGQGKGNFGIIKFPGVLNAPVTDLTSYDLVQATAIPSTQNMDMMVDPLLDGVNPFNSTPMNPGLQRALSTVYFANDAKSMSLNHRWVLLMSDGAWNAGGDPTLLIPQFVNQKIQVFSAGYGTAGQVDYATLKAIADGTAPSGSSGQATSVDSGGGTSATDLANSFLTAIKGGLTSLNSANDPEAILGTGKLAEARHAVIITPYDSKAVFLLNWNTPDSERMKLSLLTPNGELIDRQTPKTEKGIYFASDSRHQMYAIDGSYLRNDAKPNQPRFGNWWMIVSSPELASSKKPQDREVYTYDALIESSLKMQVSLDQAHYFAGDSIGVTAKLTVDGVPITHAAVKVDLTAPGRSMDNWLASIQLSDEDLKRARAALDGKDASEIYVKAYAAKLKGLLFKGFDQKASVAMLDPRNVGVYSAELNQTTVPDGHKLFVTAIGVTEQGIAFRREQTVEVRLAVKPDPRFTLVDIVDTVLTGQAISLTLRITPRDRFGNVILIDPARSSAIAVAAKHAEMRKALTTTFDGAYSIGLTYNSEARPTFSLAVFGVAVFKDRPLPAIDKLKYVDRVVAFKPGLEGAHGANQHADPSAALGNVGSKPSNRFVSLGGYGVLEVAINNQVILGQGDDDVTVFVHPDIDPRSYHVDAEDAERPGTWLPLGASAGATQAFSLKSARLRTASAIRVTDTSGRTRDAAMKPLATPGVSICGVGVVAVQQPSLSPKFQPPPNEFTPKFGPAGTNVTLFGVNLNVGTVGVKFNGVVAQIVSSSANQIVTTVPQIAAGDAKIAITTSGGTVTSQDAFKVLAALGGSG